MPVRACGRSVSSSCPRRRHQRPADDLGGQWMAQWQAAAVAAAAATLGSRQRGRDYCDSCVMMTTESTRSSCPR